MIFKIKHSALKNYFKNYKNYKNLKINLKL